MTKPRNRPSTRKPRMVEHRLPLTSPAITIALVQLEGPRPRGKHRSVLNGRDTFAWQSLEEIRSREQKAVSVIRQLVGSSEKPDLIVFPEYSLPVLESLTSLQREADEHGVIIVPGADNMQRIAGGPVFAEAAVIVPKAKPVWIAKREPSPWEHGLIDAPPPVIHTFTWTTRAGQYWLVVYPCLDLVHAFRDPVYEREGPGLFIVPMYYRDIATFWTYAHALGRRDSGSACVLCNCVGDGAAGQSSVFVAAKGDPSVTHPVLVLSEITESIAVVRIDCERLSHDPTAAVNKRGSYTLYGALGDITMAPVAEHGLESITRGVLNPALFTHLGKKMRIAFIRMERFGEAASLARDASFEVLSILGQHDLMVTHVKADAGDLFYEVGQKIPIRFGFESTTDPGQDVDPLKSVEFPFFEVETFHKVLGVPVDDAARRVFTEPGKPLPTPDDLAALVSLAADWNDRNVGSQARQAFVERKWILATTQRQPGHVAAIVAIYVAPASGSVAEQLAIFARQVLPGLVRSQAVTSIYEGVGRRLPIHYLLRVSATTDDLFTLIDSIHVESLKERLLITTSTSVVIHRLADLMLDRAFLDPVLSPEDQRYSSVHYAPYLGPPDRMRFITLERRRQEAILQLHRGIASAITSLNDSSWVSRDIRERMAVGLLDDDVAALREIHDVTQRRVEAVLVSLIDELKGRKVSVEEWFQPLGIPGSKPTDRLTYAERIKIVVHAATLQLVNADIAADGNLLPETVQLRNAYVHNRLDMISIGDVVHALKIYCGFLNRWDRH